MKTLKKVKRFLVGGTAIVAALAAVVLLVESPALETKASLVSYFELSTGTTLSGSDNTATMTVDTEDEVFILIDTNTEYITAADVKITYDSTYLGITNGSGSTVTTVNTSLYTTELSAAGVYSTNSVTATGSGSQINVSWGASTGQTYQTADTNDVFASFWVEPKAVNSSGTAMAFTFTQGEDNTTDTDATRLSGTGSTTIDTLNDCYDLTITIESAIDVTISKEADEEVYEYDPDSDTDIDYTIELTNSDTSAVTLDLEDTIAEELDDFFDELDSDDLEDIKDDMLDTVDLDPSSAADSDDIDNEESDLDDDTFDIADMSVAASDEVSVTYTVTIPEDLDLDSFNWEEEDRYGDDIHDEDIDTSGNDYDDEDDATGEPDGEWVSLGEDGEIEIELPSGMYIVNGDGDDVRVYEIDDEDVDEDTDDEEYTVSFSETCDSSYEEADNEESDSADFDLDDTNLEYARCIKITDESDGDGDAPGVDIDAIAILNPGKIMENTVTTTSASSETDTDSYAVAVSLTELFTEEVPDIEESEEETVPPPVGSLSVVCDPTTIAVEGVSTCTATYFDGVGTYTNVTADVNTGWFVDNTTVASVSAGQVTGLTAGSVYITATYLGYTSSSLLTVTEASLPDTGMGLNVTLALLAGLLTLGAYGLRLSFKRQ